MEISSQITEIYYSEKQNPFFFLRDWLEVLYRKVNYFDNKQRDSFR